VRIVGKAIPASYDPFKSILIAFLIWKLPAALLANRVKAVAVLSVRGGLQKIFNAQATSVHFQAVLNNFFKGCPEGHKFCQGWGKPMPSKGKLPRLTVLSLLNTACLQIICSPERCFSI